MKNHNDGQKLSDAEQELVSLFEAQQDTFGTWQDTQYVSDLYQSLPQLYRQKYYKAFENAAKQQNGANFIKHSHGVWLEMSRLKAILDQGHETVDPDAKTVANPDKLEFQAHTGDNNTPKSKVIEIENDIPIVRDGAPFVYEAKFLPVRYYGLTSVNSKGGFQAQHHDQVLKYQQAIESGLISGAAIEIQGRIDPEFLNWLYGSDMLAPSPVPDVELIYTLQLPSGAEYRTRIKRASNTEQHLNFTNDYKSYTAEDRNVIAGLEWALRHPDKQYIINILSNAEIHNPSAELNEYLGHENGLSPSDITDPDLYREYQRKRLETVWDHARAVQPPLYNELNQDTPLEDVYANTEQARTTLRNRVEQYQNYLRSNPHLAKIKQSYLLGEPGTQEYQDRVEAVTENLLEKVNIIRDRELGRQAEERSSFEQKFGWEGPVEGYALDIDHIMMDVIMDVNSSGNQKGRSYENPEQRFMSVEGLVDYIAYTNPDRQQREAYIYDPQKADGEQIINVNNTSDNYLTELQTKIREENIKRIEVYCDELRQKSEGDLTRTERKILRGLDLHKTGIEISRNALNRLSSAVKQAGKAIGVAKKAGDDQAFERAQYTRQNIEHRKERLKQDLLESYREAIGETRVAGLEQSLDWNESNIIKFIYTVDQEGHFRFDEERFDADRAGRSSHSELVGGANVYGAGEIAMEKRDGQWVLTEINNGSGHYRPHPSSLPYVQKALQSALVDAMQKAHSEISEDVIQQDAESFMADAELVDSLARGRPIQDMDPAVALDQQISEHPAGADERLTNHDSQEGGNDMNKRQQYDEGQLVRIEDEGESIFIFSANGRPVMFTGSQLEHIRSAHLDNEDTGSKFAQSFIDQHGGLEYAVKAMMEKDVPDETMGKYELNPHFDEPIGGDAVIDSEELRDKLAQEGKSNEEITAAITKVDEEGHRREGCYVLDRDVADELGLQETSEANIIAFPGNNDPDQVPPPVANAWQAIIDELGDDIQPSEGLGLVTMWPGGYAPPVVNDENHPMYAESQEFWKSHVILDTNEMSRGAEPKEPQVDNANNNEPRRKAGGPAGMR